MLTSKGTDVFVDVKVNLDSKVIAVVGPNEAGKTTFLKALADLETDSEPLSSIERSRGERSTVTPRSLR